MDQSSESSPSKCGFLGQLPGFRQTLHCQSCDKLRSAGEVVRCRRDGPRIEGLGDVIQIVAKATGVAAAVNATVGDCGCPRRQRNWNRLVPFTSPVPDEEPNPPSAPSSIPVP